jgi:hypothetical protein
LNISPSAASRYFSERKNIRAACLVLISITLCKTGGVHVAGNEQCGN